METTDFIHFLSLTFGPVILLGTMMLILKYLRNKRKKADDNN